MIRHAEIHPLQPKTNQTGGDQLQPGTFEFAINHLIDHKLDLSIFHAGYANDDGGRPAYDPAILLKIILFAYAKGITSSREIQWNCETNVIFKALSCDTVPHFTSIAGFLSGCPQEIEDLFEQVLLVCHQQGPLGNALLAIDGCKMPSDAAKEWSGTFKELDDKRAKIKRQIQHHLGEHTRLDQQASREDERLQRIKQTIETLDHAHERIDTFLKTARPRMGRGKQGKEVKSNVTDNESAKMTTSKGTIQGYTGVAAVDRKHQIIVDAQAFGEGQEHHALQPVLKAIQDCYQRLGIRDNLYRDGAIRPIGRMPCMPPETGLPAQSGLARYAQRSWAAGVVHRPESQSCTQLHRLDEAPYRFRLWLANIQSPHVRGRTGVCQYRDEQTP